MSTAFDLALTQRGEPALNQVEPGRRGRGEVRMKAWMPSQPVANRRCLMRAVVIHHQMHVQGGPDVGINGPQKLQKFFAAVSAMGFADDFAGRDIKRREQSLVP